MLNSSKTFLHCFCTSQFLCTIPETFSVHKCLLGQSLKNFVILCFYNCVENSRNFKTISLLGFTKSFLALIWLCAGNLAGSYFIKSESLRSRSWLLFLKLCLPTQKYQTLLRYARIPSVTYLKLLAFFLNLGVECSQEEGVQSNGQEHREQDFMGSALGSGLAQLWDRQDASLYRSFPVCKVGTKPVPPGLQ